MSFFKKIDIFSHKNINKTMAPFSYFFNTNTNTNPCMVDINIEKMIQDLDKDKDSDKNSDKDSEKELSNFRYPKKLFNYDTENYYTLAFITFMGLGFGIGFGFRSYLQKR